jgi:hypothetical protein
VYFYQQPFFSDIFLYIPGIINIGEVTCRIQVKYKGGVLMSEVEALQIHCGNCGGWFNSPFFFSDLTSFDTAMLIGNSLQCPQCGEMTDCTEENMNTSFKDGD